MARNTDLRDRGQQQAFRSQEVDNRKVLLGAVALMLLAAGALAIRNMFPDLNPFILAGLGAAAYVAYLGAALQAELARKKEDKDSAEAARAAVTVEIPGEERL